MIQLKLNSRRSKIILIALNAPCHSIEWIQSVSTGVAKVFATTTKKRDAKEKQLGLNLQHDSLETKFKQMPLKCYEMKVISLTQENIHRKKEVQRKKISATTSVWNIYSNWTHSRAIIFNSEPELFAWTSEKKRVDVLICETRICYLDCHVRQ